MVYTAWLITTAEISFSYCNVKVRPWMRSCTWLFLTADQRSRTVFTYHLLTPRYLNISERLLLNSPPLTLLFLLLSFFQARVQHGTIFWVKSTMKELTCWISLRLTIPCELKVALLSLFPFKSRIVSLEKCSMTKAVRTIWLEAIKLYFPKFYEKFYCSISLP